MVGVTTTPGLCVKGSEYQKAEHHGSSGRPYTAHPAALCGHSGLKIARRQREHKELGEESEHGKSWREGVGVDLNKTHMCMCDILKNTTKKKDTCTTVPCIISSVGSCTTPYGLTLRRSIHVTC